MLKHQLLILNRSRERAPNLRPMDCVIAALCTHLVRPSRLLKAAIVETKRKNPRFGYQRIAQQLALVFDVAIDKDVVRRVLARHYRPDAGGGGPSWLTLLGHTKDSLWSVDLFRCESLTVTSHWVVLVMDQYTRRIVGFAVQTGTLDGPSVCRMFASVIALANGPPRYLSSDHDPLFEFHRWKANLRIVDVEEVKTVPYVPLSHPFVERLIGTIRREFLDHAPFWNARDLQRKLDAFKTYYNEAQPSISRGTNAHRITATARAAWSDAVAALLPAVSTPGGGLNSSSHPTRRQ